MKVYVEASLRDQLVLLPWARSSTLRYGRMGGGESQFRYEMGKGQGPQQLENLPLSSIS